MCYDSHVDWQLATGLSEEFSASVFRVVFLRYAEVEDSRILRNGLN